MALSTAGAIGLCWCAFDWLLGIWSTQWGITALGISFCVAVLGGVIFETTEATVEDATRRKHESVFADQIKRAQWGDVDSMLYIGSAYMSGESPPLPARVRIDLAEAEFWFKRATDKRYPRAFYWLARLYWKQRKHDAMKIALEDGVTAGDAPSMSLLGRLHLYEKDLPKAAALFEAAAAKRSVIAKVGLGRSLLRTRMGSPAWFRGLWIYLSSLVIAFVIAVTKGLGDERLL